MTRAHAMPLMAEPDLCARLIALRADALARLAEADVLDAGLLRIVDDVSVILAAFDDEARVPPERPGR